MSRIRIKNFGPIKEGAGEDWIDIRKVTVFIGNQGSGKSTIAKLISTFAWMEKALTRGDYQPNFFTRKGHFRKQRLGYHRIESYCSSADKRDLSDIEYEGEAYHFRYHRGNLTILPAARNDYALPQIMYVPAERNFIANVKQAKALKSITDSLVEFVTEYDNAKAEMKGPIALPINHVDLEYDKLNDTVNLKTSDYRLPLSDASSGFQSIVPLYLVSWFLSNAVKRQSESKVSANTSSEELERFRKDVDSIVSDKGLTDEQKRVAISALSRKFNKSAFFNIVEEPEQNLFPTSQWELLKKLFEFNNVNLKSKLVLTTHSPYLVNYISIAVQAAHLQSLLNKKDAPEKYQLQIDAIIAQQAQVSGADVVIYQMDETNGTIKKLPDTEGIPSDKNYLNQSLRHGNEMFDQLLEIEQSLFL